MVDFQSSCGLRSLPGSVPKIAGDKEKRAAKAIFYVSRWSARNRAVALARGGRHRCHRRWRTVLIRIKRSYLG
jgi:hypothetical protein